MCVNVKHEVDHRVAPELKPTQAGAHIARSANVCEFAGQRQGNVANWIVMTIIPL
eukprot:m.15238 g.15238  ORF g.15238 m.15238 type:complete len:55 (+) comp6537_c0_seq1:361-525(+)